MITDGSPTDALRPQPAEVAGCESCGAPMDERQRYCLVCGTHRRGGNDPAARYLAATARRKMAATGGPSPVPLADRRTLPAAVLLAVIAVPVALAVGVIVGHSSARVDPNLLAVLHSQKPPIVEIGGGGTAASSAPTAVSTQGQPVATTWTHGSGFTVELEVLPAGATAASAARAQRADRRRGATDVGTLSPGQFTIVPAPPAGDSVVFSGYYPTRAAATAALRRLLPRFPAARVVQIGSSGASGGGAVVAQTSFGTVHRVAGAKPTNTQLAQGAKAAQQDARSVGQQASGSGLPDVVAVP